MQISCAICSDLLIPQDECYGTKCGHIFHHTCLLQWLERSGSCPQCRTKASEKNIFRVYFNIQSGPIADPSELQNKVDSLSFKVLLKDKDIKNNLTEIDTLKKQTVDLRDHSKELENKLLTSDVTIASLREQINILKKRNKNVEKLETECTTLRSRLEFYNNIETIVKGTAEEADSILNNCSGSLEARSHATYASILKKELQSAAEKRKEMSKKLRDAETTNNSLLLEMRMLKANLKKSLEAEKRVEEDLKHCEEERSSLRVKLQSVLTATSCTSSSTPSSSALKRLIHESPAPEALLQQPPLTSPKDTQSKKEKSPYLKVKSSSIGLTPLRPAQAKLPQSSIPFSIFKKPRLHTLTCSSAEDSEEFYDGMGGHSKLDEFPRPFTSIIVPKKIKNKSISKIKLKDASSLKIDLFLQK